MMKALDGDIARAWALRVSPRARADQAKVSPGLIRGAMRNSLVGSWGKV